MAGKCSGPNRDPNRSEISENVVISWPPDSCVSEEDVHVEYYKRDI